MSRFEELEVWKESCRIAEELYRALGECRDFGLRDQMTRAAVSIPSNIAEGAERGSAKDFIHFLHIAQGSCAELRTQIYIAIRVGVLAPDTGGAFSARCGKISRMLQKLVSSLSSPDRRPATGNRPPEAGFLIPTGNR